METNTSITPAKPFPSRSSAVENCPVCSILVAAYNASAFISCCVESLLAQTQEGVEIIIIDDGSTDETLSIVKDYERRYEAIRVLALPVNHGQAYARNQGLALARGKYIGYLDADDWFASDALAHAVSTFEHYPQTDCVLFNMHEFAEGKGFSPTAFLSFEVMSGKEAFVESLTWRIHGVYMARASLFRQYPYDESARAYSDDNTTRIHYYHAREVRTCSGIYYYRQHATSVTHQVSLRHFDHLKANLHMKEVLVSWQVSDDLMARYENLRWLVVVECYGFYRRHHALFTPYERKRALALIRYAWRTIEPKYLLLQNRYKFGYMPLHGSWSLFRWQEEIYFTLKKALKR